MKISFMCLVVLSVCLVQADESAPGFDNNEQVVTTMPPLGKEASHEEDPVASALLAAREAQDPVSDFLQEVMEHPTKALAQPKKAAPSLYKQETELFDSMQETQLFQKLTNQDPKLNRKYPVFGVGSPDPGSFQHDDEIPDVKLEAPTVASEDDSEESVARDEMVKNKQELDNMMLIQRGLEMGGVSNKAMMKPHKRPGYIRRCVVTSYDHARYHRQHQFFANAKKMWSKFKKGYNYAKTHFGHFKRKKRSKATKRKERFFLRLSNEARSKARRARHRTTPRRYRRREEMPMMIQLNRRYHRKGRHLKRYQHKEYRKLVRKHHKSCSGRSWCETFHACKKGDRRHQFHSWVKGQGYRFYKGACAHSNGRYGRRHKFWRGAHSYAQCKARCDRMGRSCQGITMTKAVKCRVRRVHRRAPAFRARERARKARSRKSCNGRSWCETFHACKKGDRRHQFHSWVKGQGYRFYKGACAHSNGRYGRRHKFWRGNHSFGQCKARCDRMGRSCQGITMTKAVKCRGRALSNYYKRYAHHIRRAGHRARVARHHARRARELAVAKTDRERARKARVKASHFDEHAALHRIADRAREQARKARIKATKPRKPAGRGWRWSPTSHRWLRKPRRGHGWRWNGHRWAMTRAHKRRLAIARRMRHAAAKMRERAKKARVRATRISIQKVRVARWKARKARAKLTHERSQKKDARCLHWIWWPKRRANHHWYKSAHYARVVERARMAYRRRFGFAAKTPALSAVPIRKKRVYRQANYGNVPKRLLTNVFELKAYCISVHEVMLAAKKGNKKLSSIGSFLYRFGVDKRTRNAFGEFKALTRSYKKFYKYGINKYVFDNAAKAMSSGPGILFMRDKRVKLNHKMLGLQTGEAQAFDKWSVRWKPFLRAVHEVKYNNGYLSQALKARKEFKKEQCKCKMTRRFARFGKCAKHMAYDRKPWCVVNSRCEGASYNRRYKFKWQYC
jgi:hypothetical protein